MIRHAWAKRRKNTAGFTVVELATVVSVIVILAAVALVAYPSYLTTTRDNARKSDLQQIASALKAYSLKKNDYVGVGSGCGLFGDGSGWFNLNFDNSGGWYPKSIPKCMQEAGVLTSEDTFVDPSGCRSDSGGTCGTSPTSPTTAYMKASCTKNGQPVVYVIARLEGQPRRDAEIDALCDTGSIAWFNATSQKWGTNYGMNYYVTVR